MNLKFKKNVEHDKAELLVNTLGKVKHQDEESHNAHSILNQHIRSISRVVMRYPNQQVKEKLYSLHTTLNKYLEQFDDNALIWLLKATADESYGGFRDDPKKLRSFLKASPEQMSISRLISGIETIATAMGYRSIYAEWTDAVMASNNQSESAMDEFIQKTTKQCVVNYIGNLIIRDQDDRLEEENKEKQSETDIFCEPNYVSDASDVEDAEVQKPKRKVHSSRYSRHHHKNKNEFSWVGLADKTGVPVRAHISGSASLTMAGIESLFQLMDDENKHWFENDENAQMLAAVLIIAQFQRGDFHTFAESAVGITYYLEARIKDIDTFNTPSPQAALKLALQMVTNACSNEIIDNMSLKKALGLMSDIVMSFTNHKGKNDLKSNKENKKVYSELASARQKVLFMHFANDKTEEEENKQENIKFNNNMDSF